MKKQNRLHVQSSRGQSLVEFAIGLTAILILLAGAVDFGIGLFHYIAMRDAAQEGALYGSMNPPNPAGTYTCGDPEVANICSRILNAAGSTGIIHNIYADPNTTITVVAPTVCEGNAITVNFEYNYPISMPFIGAFVGDFIRLRASVTDTILTPPC